MVHGQRRNQLILKRPKGKHDKNAYQDMYRDVYFSDDWDEKEGESPWESAYEDEKYAANPSVV